MKILSSILTVAMIAFSSLQVSANIDNLKPSDIKSQISKILMHADFDLQGEEDQVLNIKFMVNNRNEIVVLTTDQSEYDAQVKNALNYRKLIGEGIAITKPYQITVKIVKD